MKTRNASSIAKAVIHTRLRYRDKQQKDLIQKAARLLHMSANGFICLAAEHVASGVIATRGKEGGGILTVSAVDASSIATAFRKESRNGKD